MKLIFNNSEITQDNIAEIMNVKKGYSFYALASEAHSLLQNLSEQIDSYSIKLHQIGAEMSFPTVFGFDSFEPEFARKLNFYVNAVDEIIRTPDDNPTNGCGLL